MPSSKQRPRRMTPYMVALNHVQNLNRGGMSVVDLQLVPSFAFDASTLALPAGLTVSRAGTGAYHTSTGLVAIAAIDVPRFDYDPVSGAFRGLLIEEARTNLLSNSEELIYNWSAGGLTVAENVVTAPDGTLHGNSLTSANANNACRTRQMFSAVSGQVYSFSLYMKAGTTNGFISFSDGGLGVHATLKATLSGSGSVLVAGSGASGRIYPLKNGWYRVVLSWVSTVSGAVYCDVGTWDGTADEFGYPGTGATGQVAYVWGAQLEAAATASSYIQTQGTPITRPADVVTAGSIAGWVNPAVGALVATFTRGAGAVNAGVIASLNNGSASSLVALLAAGDGTTLQGRFSVAGVAGNPGDLTPALVAGAANTVVLGYGPLGGVQMLSNGGTLAAKSQPAALFGTGGLTQLCLGCKASKDGDFLNGWLQQMAYYPRELTQVELRALTAKEGR